MMYSCLCARVMPQVYFLYFFKPRIISESSHGHTSGSTPAHLHQTAGALSICLAAAMLQSVQRRWRLDLGTRYFYVDAGLTISLTACLAVKCASIDTFHDMLPSSRSSGVCI